MPSDHMLYGFIAALIILFLFPSIGAYGLLIIFLASFLVDFDHYLYYVYKTGDFNFSNAVSFYLDMTSNMIKNKKYAKSPLMIFHTVEFVALLFILGFFNSLFIYIALGIIIHIVLDIVDLRNKGILHVRSHSAINHYFFKRRLSIF